MPQIAHAGHNVWVKTVGEGAPTLMIHCALSRHEMLLPLAESIGGRVTLFDMPGHGRSADWDGQAEYQGLITEIAAGLCEGPTHVIGHSFGATAALRLAVERPDLVSRLTLIEPVYFAAAKGTDAHQVHKGVFRPFVGAMLMGDEDRAAEIFNGLWGDADWADLSPRRRQYLTDRIHLVVAGGGAIEEDADGITSSERLAEVQVPVTLIRGADSPAVIAAIHEALVSRISGASDHVVGSAAHMLPATHVDEVAAIIRAAEQGTD